MQAEILERVRFLELILEDDFETIISTTIKFFHSGCQKVNYFYYTDVKN